MREQLRSVFAQALQLPPDFNADDLRYRHTEEWDSLGHINLVVTLEIEFDVEFSPEQVTLIQSFATAEETLRELGVEG